MCAIERAVMDAYDKTSIQINRCKRILALVDTYVETETASARTDLRKALMEEFEAPAIAPPVAAGSIDTKMLDSLMMAYASAVVKSRDGNQSEIRGAVVNMLKFFDDSAAQQHAAGYAKKISDAECGALAMLRIERERGEKAEAELESWVHTNRIDDLQRGYNAALARVNKLEAQLSRRHAPLSPEAQRAIAAVRAGGQAIAAALGGLVFLNDGTGPGEGELDCPACGGSGLAGDVAGGGAP